ncbi:MAG: hypothetical protein QG640_68 [Patescibacteria group bacterium]|nr:hypothetical protein [Patescibacteria group bacterium]
MPSKKVVQDIVPTSRRSIRNIPIEHEIDAPVKTPRRKVASRPAVRAIREEERDEEVIEEPVFVNKKPSKKKKNAGKYLLTFVIVFICIAIIGVALSLSYSKAVVTITPKVTNFDVNGTFTAKKNAPGTDLGYEVVTVSDEVHQIIPATSGPAVQTKAKGTAVIYNNFSATAQTLVAGTRLSDSDGLIYRTASTISVPGKKTSPGSIEVAIVADQAGANYNAAVADLKGDYKIVGYKGTPKYDGFYARLKTDITGGFSGNKMIIAPEAQKAAVTALQTTLREQLLTKLKTAVPPGFILYDSAYTIEYTNPEPIMKENTSADVSVKGVAYAAIFKADSLIKFIAGKEIQKFPSDTYTVGGDTDLEFKVSNIKDFSIKKGTPLIFTLKGPISITGTFSESKLKDELKGIDLKASNAVFGKYTAISNAYALITPFWMRSFPNSTEKIILEYKKE